MGIGPLLLRFIWSSRLQVLEHGLVQDYPGGRLPRERVRLALHGLGHQRGGTSLLSAKEVLRHRFAPTLRLVSQPKSGQDDCIASRAGQYAEQPRRRQLTVICTATLRLRLQADVATSGVRSHGMMRNAVDSNTWKLSGTVVTLANMSVSCYRDSDTRGPSRSGEQTWANPSSACFCPVGYV